MQIIARFEIVLVLKLAFVADTNDIFTENLNMLIEYSGLTDESFSNMMGFSLRKLKYLKRGTGSLKVQELEKISGFFQIKKLTTKKIIVERNLRGKLLKIHAKNEEYKKPLEERPTIVYAIKRILLADEKFNHPAEVRTIRDFFKKQGWDYNSSSISTALKRMPDKIKIEPHPSKKGTFVYSRR